MKPIFEEESSDEIAYSVAQTAKMLGIGVTKTYDLINTGRIVAHKLDNRTVIFSSYLKRYRDTLPVYSAKGE